MEIVSGSPTTFAPLATTGQGWKREGLEVLEVFCRPVGRSLSCQSGVLRTSGHDLPTRPKERWAAGGKSDVVGAVGRVVGRKTSLGRCRSCARI